MKAEIKMNLMDIADWDKLTKEDLIEKDGNHSFLHYVILHDHWAKLSKELKEFSLTQTNDGDEKIIHLMVRMGKVKTIPEDLLTHELLSSKGPDGNSVYHTLTEWGYIHDVPKKLWTQESLTLPNNSGVTPLHNLLQFNCDMVPESITLNDLLLKANDGQTPLLSWANSPNWAKIPDKFLTKETLAMPDNKGNTVFSIITILYVTDHHNNLLRHKETLEKKFKNILTKVNNNSIEKLCGDPDPILHKPARQEASKRKLVKELSQSEQSLEI
jgi:hypothetical protein